LEHPRGVGDVFLAGPIAAALGVKLIEWQHESLLLLFGYSTAVDQFVQLFDRRYLALGPHRQLDSSPTQGSCPAADAEQGQPQTLRYFLVGYATQVGRYELDIGRA
jgi:hypothetical protein